MLKSINYNYYDSWSGSKKLRATLSGWDNTFWNLQDWYREA